MEAIKDYTEEIQEACANIKNQLIIDDIFDIARGVYNSYNDYVHAKQKIIEEVRKHNNSCLAIGGNKYTFTYYAEPVIINEHDFNYIIDKHENERLSKYREDYYKLKKDYEAVVSMLMNGNEEDSGIEDFHFYKKSF